MPASVEHSSPGEPPRQGFEIARRALLRRPIARSGCGTATFGLNCWAVGKQADLPGMKSAPSNHERAGLSGVAVADNRCWAQSLERIEELTAHAEHAMVTREQIAGSAPALKPWLPCSPDIGDTVAVFSRRRRVCRATPCRLRPSMPAGACAMTQSCNRSDSGSDARRRTPETNLESGADRRSREKEARGLCIVERDDGERGAIERGA